MRSIRNWLVKDFGHFELRLGGWTRQVKLRRIHLTTAIAIAVAALIIGLAGGFAAGRWFPSRQQITQSCPHNRATLGCVVRLYAAHADAPVKDPTGPHFPDVSSYQGHPDWRLAKPYISGAIVKAYEYTQDPDFAYNAQQLSANGIKWGAYLFVRGCSYGPAFGATVRPYISHISVLVLDMEVPAAAGCAPTLYASLHSQFPNTRVVIYSSPGLAGSTVGSNTAGLSFWVAAYGPASPPCILGVCHVGSSTGQTILGWQYTDGAYGQVTPIPGVGTGDVSADYSIFGPTAPPVPACSRTQCYGKYASNGTSGYLAGGLRAKAYKPASGHCSRGSGCVERQLMYWWNHCAKCTHSHRLWIRYQLQAVYHHLDYLIQHSVPADNVKYNRGERKHNVWVAGVLAEMEPSFNAYRKAH